MNATAFPYRNVTPTGRRRHKPPLADNVFGMLIFVATEVMFFMALISAFIIIRAGVEPWSPPPGVRLPVFATAGNTVLLLLSGVLLYQAGQRFATEGPTARVQSLFRATAVLGTFFVLFQGYEWVRLINYGMTMTSGIFGACSFLLIGTHGLHAAIATVALSGVYVQSKRHALKLDHVRAMQVFWYFIVGIWPILYGLVYF
jgi:heme/copper-type cytochrome/quinol oxidase subunit 3